jgi:hypothetical protein
MLIDKIRNKENGIVLYGMVPPKKGSDSQQIHEIARRQIERLQSLSIDGLVLYDIQDETTRLPTERPFPFIETIDPALYSRQYLSPLSIPKIIYRSVGKYSREELSNFLLDITVEKNLTVFVGPASKNQSVTMTLSDAYVLKNEISPNLLLGGVVIPERHLTKGDEHIRVCTKIKQGCSFFISQGVYDVNASKNFLSDYFYYCSEQLLEPAPIIFTFTPCGSLKTLQFMKWLGISIPKWLENELIHAKDILQQSIDFAEQNWRELSQFARTYKIPVGCNIESVAIRRVEIEASIELLKRVINTSKQIYNYS